MNGGVGDLAKRVGQNLKQEKPEKLSVEEFVKKEQALSNIGMREKMIAFLFPMCRFLVYSTVGIIVLQGFKLWGFNLEPGFLRWLGGATIGEIGILACIAYRALFKEK